MFDLAQTQTCEIMKAPLSQSGRATVTCPFCKKCHYDSVPRQLHNKPVRAKCECGKSFPILFDSRGHYRKDVRLPGEYRNGPGEKVVVTVTTLSFTGAGLEAEPGKHLVKKGEIIQLRFALDDCHNSWIKANAIVRQVDGNRLGVKFVGLNGYEQKCLGFYLMP